VPQQTFATEKLGDGCGLSWSRPTERLSPGVHLVLPLRLLLSLCVTNAFCECKSGPQQRAASSSRPTRQVTASKAGTKVANAGQNLGEIAHYRVEISRGTIRGKTVIGLRAFERSGTPMVLVVSPEDMKTSVLRRDAVQLEPATWAELNKQPSPYLRALSDTTQHASVLQDAGMTHVLPAEHGVVLTVDLCPSKRPFDKILFQKVVATFFPEEHPVPIAIAVTGLWMEKHPRDLDWLLSMVKAGKLEITWINHSYNHRYDPKLPLTQNFLLEKGTLVEDEVLRNELSMIQKGITPAPLFRFPGLISNAELVQTVVRFGLIPIGSDAWLAKKERAHPGDIVLVHGNGNEPQGIEAFMSLLGQEKKEIRTRQFLLLDLRESIEEEESKEL
jgi:peptidoglycan/xylan/chitin deacetylase (PgdA/CDA1 family)